MEQILFRFFFREQIPANARRKNGSRAEGRIRAGEHADAPSSDNRDAIKEARDTILSVKIDEERKGYIMDVEAEWRRKPLGGMSANRRFRNLGAFARTEHQTKESRDGNGSEGKEKGSSGTTAAGRTQGIRHGARRADARPKRKDDPGSLPERNDPIAS